MNNPSISAAAVTNRQAASLRSTRTMTMISLLAAVSFVLSFLEFPVPLSPSFARMDLSDFPALVGYRRFVKRAFDMVMSALMLLLLSPVIVAETKKYLNNIDAKDTEPVPYLEDIRNKEVVPTEELVK